MKNKSRHIHAGQVKRAREDALTHRRECHKCPFDGKGSDECLKCLGPADGSYKGISYVWIDNHPDPDGLIERGHMAFRSREEYSDEFTGRSALPDTVEEALVPIIATFFQMTDQELIVVKRKYNGEDDVEVARAIGVTKQRVNAIVHSVCQKIPRMAMVIQAMRRLGIGGAKRKHRKFIQTEMFDENGKCGTFDSKEGGGL